MKKFIVKTLLLSGIFLFILTSLDEMVTKGLRNSHSSIFVNMTKIHNHELNADLIINGSSKALVQFSTIIIDSMLNVNSYNLGMNGTLFQLQKLVYDLYVKENNKPKYIIQVVSHGTLRKEENMTSFKRFAPYLEDSLVKETAKQLVGFKAIDYYIPMSRYSGFSIDIFNGISNSLGIKLPSDKNTKIKGYSPKNRTWDNSFKKFKDENPDGIYVDISSSMVSSFDKFIKSCKDNGIKIVMIYPPTYYESHAYINNRSSILEMYDKLADENDIPFLDYSSDTFFYSQKYFYNSQHLNKKGAEVFTIKLCQDLENYIE